MRHLFRFEHDPMTHDEQAFFKAIGTRIAELRKNSAITQVQLAATVSVSQQTVASWEAGRRDVPVSLLPALARALGTGVDTLVGQTSQPARRGPTPKLLRQVERLSQLPKAKQRLVMEILDGVLNHGAR